MFLSICLRSSDPALPATDLGFLLHKHPDRLQSFSVSTGRAHVFYPVATAQECTAALLLEVDPIGLVRARLGGQDAFALAQYVNDRPYAASSMLAVALGKVFATARQGRCDDRPDLPGRPLDLTIHVPALPCRGGAEWARRCFEPLGWQVDAEAVPLDAAIPDWGESRYVDLTLTGSQRLADALQHLYVLLPVLDATKHYWVGPDEVDKLIRNSTGWLASHPERDAIALRYLAHQRSFARTAVDRLLEVDESEQVAVEQVIADDGPNGKDGDVTELPAQVGETGTARAGETGTARAGDASEAHPEPDPSTPEPADPTSQPRPERLKDARQRAILDALAESGATSVADLGCGEGSLLRALLALPRFTRVLGADVSDRALQRAADRLGLARLPERRRERIELIQSSLTYRDPRLAGFDAAVLQEVIEHIDPPRLTALERSVFGSARPGTVIVTTPNIEWNVRYGELALRHGDHRFEWNRAEFRDWAEQAAARYGYEVRLTGAGEVDPDLGQPTQVAVFTVQAAAPPSAAGDGTRAPATEPTDPTSATEPTATADTATEGTAS